MKKYIIEVTPAIMQPSIKLEAGTLKEAKKLAIEVAKGSCQDKTFCFYEIRRAPRTMIKKGCVKKNGDKYSFSTFIEN